MTIQILANATTCKLVGASRDAKLAVQGVLSYLVDGADHMPSVRSGGWDGRSSFLDFAAGTFPRGFLTLVQSTLIKAGHKVQVVMKPLPEPLGPVNPKVDDFPEDPRYDYQMEVVEKLLRHGQIISQLATGAGKSRVAKLAAARIARPTLFLTTRGILMYQMRDSFMDLGHKVGVMGDGEFSPKKGVNVGMVQTIMSKLKEPDPEDAPGCRARAHDQNPRLLRVRDSGRSP
jgi:hypothetical protein